MSELEKPKLKKIIGLRNIITDGKQWKYLLFYDVDNPSEADIAKLIDSLNFWNISYIIYKTKAGIHIIGLTPLKIEQHASIFSELQSIVPEYYSGQTIRLSRKQGEKRELIFYNLDYPIILNLYSIYEKRFLGLKEWYNEKQKKLLVESVFVDNWRLVFEKYWTSKV